MTTPRKPTDPVVIASYILTGIMLWLVLYKGLLAALFSGLLVYALVHLLAPVLGRQISDQRQRMIAVALLSGLIVTVLAGGVWATQQDPPRRHEAVALRDSRTGDGNDGDMREHRHSERVVVLTLRHASTKKCRHLHTTSVGEDPPAARPLRSGDTLRPR